MEKFSARKRKKKTGHLHQIPGQMVYVGDKDRPLQVEIFDYTPAHFQHITSQDYQVALPYRDSPTVTWVDVNGLSQVQKIKELSAHYGLHPLLQEDIVNTKQRPKFEEFEGGIFLALKMLAYHADGKLVKEHLSLVLGRNYVLTFHESDAGSFEELRKRIEFSAGRIRTKAADYLMYTILDAVVDDYFVVVDGIADQQEQLENELFSKNPRADITEAIQHLKREIMSARKAVQPLRESIKQLENTQHDLIHRKTRNYLRDLSEHSVQIVENVETYREMIWSLMEMYMATVSNRMNEVMKVLTIMASIFIPLTFIAGIYGMNFDYMPELHFRYAYFVVLGLMFLLFLGMLWYFKRKRWL